MCSKELIGSEEDYGRAIGHCRLRTHSQCTSDAGAGRYRQYGTDRSYLAEHVGERLVSRRLGSGHRKHVLRRPWANDWRVGGAVTLGLTHIDQIHTWLKGF